MADEPSGFQTPTFYERLRGKRTKDLVLKRPPGREKDERLKTNWDKAQEGFKLIRKLSGKR